MPQGSIKTLTDRGFGFIVPEDETSTGKDLFFHRSNVDGVDFNALRQGQRVSYELGTDERRGTPIAIHVQPLP